MVEDWFPLRPDIGLGCWWVGDVMAQMSDLEKVQYCRAVGHKPAVVYWSEKAKFNTWKAEYLSDCETMVEYSFCQSVANTIERTIKRLDRIK